MSEVIILSHLAVACLNAVTNCSPLVRIARCD